MLVRLGGRLVRRAGPGGPPACRRRAHLYRVSSGSSSISRSSTPSVQNLILVTPWPHTRRGPRSLGKQESEARLHLKSDLRS